ncbi:spermidine synthase [Legionella londiniensis]|uniref:Spermidine synthase n=1 Tax=Legionella londiniensis TaxID=45068 RepID=A0A0W0VM30_9GAMM|nr:hypothetical protein [Legionella londiniensis]KTD21102.1 spermidine synthase [Legionella londiniensis]STX93124.1 spermidine synthase [Legionella londiniensis]
MWKTRSGRVIYQSPGGAKVHQNLFYRWLTLGSDALQTVINRQNPAKPALKYIPHLILPAKIKSGNSCLLGLGGAGVGHALNDFLTGSSMIAVEQSEEVIQIAETYFMLEKIKNLTVVHEDASQFVKTCQSQFNHLIVDLYNADSFPEQCNNKEFFAHCRRLLISGGILAVNIASLKQYQSVSQHILQQFKMRTISLPVSGTANMVILAIRANTVTPLLRLIAENIKLKKLIWDRDWGYIAEI